MFRGPHRLGFGDWTVFLPAHEAEQRHADVRVEELVAPFAPGLRRRRWHPRPFPAVYVAAQLERDEAMDGRPRRDGDHQGRQRGERLGLHPALGDAEQRSETATVFGSLRRWQLAHPAED